MNLPVESAYRQDLNPLTIQGRLLEQEPMFKPEEFMRLDYTRVPRERASVEADKPLVFELEQITQAKQNTPMIKNLHENYFMSPSVPLQESVSKKNRYPRPETVETPSYNVYQDYFDQPQRFLDRIFTDKNFREMLQQHRILETSDEYLLRHPDARHIFSTRVQSRINSQMSRQKLPLKMPRINEIPGNSRFQSNLPTPPKGRDFEVYIPMFEQE